MTPTPSPVESKDTNVGALVALIGVLFILLGGTLLATRLLNRWLNRLAALRNPPVSPMADHHLPPEPRLQANPTVDLLRLRDVENVTLTNYAWIDPSVGRARIPIERAMAILAEREKKR